MDAHHRLLIAAALTVIAFFVMRGHVSFRSHLFITWDCFSFSILVMAWLRMITANPQQVRRTARLQDTSRTAIFVFVIISACASLFALAGLLGSTKGLPKALLSEHVALSVGTVVCSWLLVHTMFALRYAHHFYGLDESDAKPGIESRNRNYVGGLDFPDEKHPDYLDFAYFAFVIGMTCQVSDVQISSRKARRLALLQGILSFGFNTVILGLSVNIISSLLS